MKPVVLYDDVRDTVVMILSSATAYISVLECSVLFPFGELHSHGTCGVLQRAFENKGCHEHSKEGISLVHHASSRRFHRQIQRYPRRTKENLDEKLERKTRSR